MDTVLIADDHPLFRAALAEAVRRVLPKAEILDVARAADARQTLTARRVDLLLLDLHMEDSDGFGFLMTVKHAHPDVPVVIVSASEEADVPRRALAFGASGFIAKSSNLSAIVKSIEAVRFGDLAFPDDPGDAEPVENALASLTPAQMKVLIGLRDGRLNKQIAYDMGVTEATVKAHVTAIFRKLNVINRTQAVLAAQALSVSAPATSDPAAGSQPVAG